MINHRSTTKLVSYLLNVIGRTFLFVYILYDTIFAYDMAIQISSMCDELCPTSETPSNYYACYTWTIF